MEFTPHSAVEAPAPQLCAMAVEVFEGDIATLTAARAEPVGQLHVSGSEADPVDVGERAAEYGATQLFKVAEQRQQVQSGGVMIGTGGPGFSTGMMVPTTHEESYATWRLYRVADQAALPVGLRCPPAGR